MGRKNVTDVIGGGTYEAQPHPAGSLATSNKQRPCKYYHNSHKYFKAISPAPTFGNGKVGTASPVVESEQQQSLVQRSSPRNIPSTYHKKTSPSGSPKSVSPRTSPGLLGRHYAGCKFSEPPAPGMLPLPPQHWTLTTSPAIHSMPKNHSVATLKQQQQQHNLSQQLKVLLKVQA